jgi:hypothetical protein
MLGMARETNIGSNAELEMYLSDLLALVKNEATRAKLEARIRARVAADGVVSFAAVEPIGYSAPASATDGTVVERKGA